MAFVESGIGGDPRLDGLEDVRRYLLREVMPVLKALRIEVNRERGNLVEATGDYSASNKDRHIIYTAAGSGTVTLPDPETVKEQTYTVFRTASAGAVTVAAGVSSYMPSAASSVELVSDGVSYHVK